MPPQLETMSWARQAARKRQIDCGSGAEIGTVEGDDDHGCCGEGSDDEPVATADPEVGDGTPEEVDEGGDGEEGDDVALTVGADAALAEEE